MVLRTTLAAAAAACALTGASAYAQDSTLQNDLSCAVIGLSMTGTANGNAQQQQAGSLISVYYIGRIKAQAPQLDLEQALYDRILAFTVVELESEQQRCATEFRAFGAELQTMGANLQARGRALQQDQQQQPSD